jgi:N-acetylmuramoyl-L-alanine amidase
MSPVRFTAVGLGMTLALAAAGCSRPPQDIPQVGMVQKSAPIYIESGWEPPATMLNWQYIIVHHSATDSGNATLFGRWHKSKGWDGLGYHFVIGNGDGSPDGAVEISYRWTRQLTGAHVGGDNNIGKIGICLVGNFDKSRPTAAQMASLRRLVAFLQVRCSIPACRVCGHREVAAPGHTHCPGRNFSMLELRTELVADPPRYDASAVIVKH